MWTGEESTKQWSPHFICKLHLGITSIIFMLGICALTLFLCAQNFKTSGVNRFPIHVCARLQACKTCFQCFGPNSLSFYRIKIIFSVFWEPTKNATQRTYLFVLCMARFAVAGVFACVTFFLNYEFVFQPQNIHEGDIGHFLRLTIRY